MMEDNKGCRNQLIFGAIWLLGGFINLIVFRLVLNEDSLLANMLPFILPALSFIAGTRLMQVKDFARWIFGKKLSQIESEVENPKRKYGTTVIVASVLLFLIGGFLTSIFQQTAPNHYRFYLFAGLVWGIVWYLLMQLKIVNHLIIDDE
jgi:hypothetical protein